MRLSKHTDTTEQVKEYVCSGSRSRNIRLKESVSKRFPLGSAHLPSLVTTPYNRTTTHLLVVRLYTLKLYGYKSLVVQLYPHCSYNMTYELKKRRKTSLFVEKHIFFNKKQV